MPLLKAYVFNSFFTWRCCSSVVIFGFEGGIWVLIAQIPCNKILVTSFVCFSIPYSMNKILNIEELR